MTGTRAVIKISAMSPDLEQDCVSCAAYALKEKNLVEQRSMAQFIKRELDRKYGFVWHVIVGRSFGSYVAHDEQNFCYFFIGDCAFLIWRTESKPSKIVDIAALRAAAQKKKASIDGGGGGEEEGDVSATSGADNNINENGTIDAAVDVEEDGDIAFPVSPDVGMENNDSVVAAEDHQQQGGATEEEERYNHMEEEQANVVVEDKREQNLAVEAVEDNVGNRDQVDEEEEKEGAGDPYAMEGEDVAINEEGEEGEIGDGELEADTEMEGGGDTQ